MQSSEIKSANFSGNIACLLLASAACSPPALAAPPRTPCEPGYRVAAFAPGPHAAISTSMVWDADGAGGQPPVLVVGGDFLQAGDVAVRRVAMWDGAAWRPLGEGLPSAPRTFGVYQGTLYAGRDRASTSEPFGSTHLQRWTGSTWEYVQDFRAPSFGFILSMAEYQGSLYVGGNFRDASLTSADNYLRRWDGQAWRVINGAINSSPRAMVVHNGELIVGGYYGAAAGGVTARGVAAFDGTTFRALGTITNGGIRTLLSRSNGDLVVGGEFRGGGSSSAWYVARWDGQDWRGVGWPGYVGYVNALGEHNGQLIAAGENPAWLMRQSGNLWEPFGEPRQAEILTLTSFNGELIAGGEHGLTTRRPIERWDGTSWKALGPGLNGRVSAVSEHDGRVIVGGEFTLIDRTPASYIAAWDGTDWGALGDGFDAPVHALVMHAGVLYAGGEFSASGAVALGHIARWDGMSWSAVGSGLDGIVRALMVYNDEIHAGGDFVNAGGTPVNYVAKWTGSAWEALAAGVAAPVREIATYNDELVVSHWNTGGAANTGVLAWNGSAWRLLRSWDNVTGMSRYREKLAITRAGEDGLTIINAFGVIETFWSEPFNGPFHAMQNYKGEMILAGNYEYSTQSPAPGVPGRNTRGVVRWRGGSGFVFPSPISAGEPQAMGIIRNDLVIAGDMSVDTVEGVKATIIVWEGCERMGDLDCNAEFWFTDIDDFVAALIDPQTYYDIHPWCDRMLADLNEDGVVNFQDIGPFVRLLTDL